MPKTAILKSNEKDNLWKIRNLSLMAKICISQKSWSLFLDSQCVQDKVLIRSTEEAVYICINKEGRQVDKLFNNLVHNHKVSLNWLLISSHNIWLNRKGMQKEMDPNWKVKKNAGGGALLITFTARLLDIHPSIVAVPLLSPLKMRKKKLPQVENCFWH